MRMAILVLRGNQASLAKMAVRAHKAQQDNKARRAKMVHVGIQDLLGHQVVRGLQAMQASLANLVLQASLVNLVLRATRDCQDRKASRGKPGCLVLLVIMAELGLMESKVSLATRDPRVQTGNQVDMVCLVRMAIRVR